jgi:hypothetical protein
MDPRDHTFDIKIDDLRQIVEVSNPSKLLFDFNQALWRGHGDAEWPLQPRVFRRKYNESGLIGHFQMRAPTRSHTKTPEPDDYFGWLFLAQHYGLPTRLLDWTENLLVASYFAVEDDKEKDRDGCIWALRPHGLNRHFGGSDLVQIRGRNVKKIAECAFVPEEDCDPAILAIDGREIDLRMLLQMGRFTFHSIATPIQHLPGSADWLHRYIIPKEHKQKVRLQLDAMGIRRSNIFPDLTNLAAELSGTWFD